MTNSANRDGQLTRRALATAVLGAGVIAAVAPASAQTAAPAATYGAPIVEVVVPSGILSAEQKSELIRRITDVVVAAVNLPPDPTRFQFVEVFETAENGFGVNGKVFVPKR
ncbi:MAG: tautomerase family protein [Alphaproteobacteria bacterium]|nr:tautomerase family protein [Alphaproteobacteria bacterium]